MNFLTEYFPMIFRGFLLTVQMTFFGAIVGLLIGIILAIGDMYGGKPISAMIKIYVEFFRGSPLIVQLFIFYYSIPNLLNVLLNNYTVGLMVFALNSAAYQKGYIKGAMESVFEDQMTAALSLGLSKVQEFPSTAPFPTKVAIRACGSISCDRHRRSSSRSRPCPIPTGRSTAISRTRCRRARSVSFGCHRGERS